MANLIATIGFIWIALQYIIPPLTKGNVSVTHHFLSMVSPALIMAITLLMIIGGLTILTLAIIDVTTTRQLVMVHDNLALYFGKEFLSDTIAMSAALRISGFLLPSFITVSNGRWAVLASLPIALFMSVAGTLTSMAS